MLKSINIDRPTKFIIIKDGNKVSELYVSKMQGFIEVDGFKHVETMNDLMHNEIIVKVEV